MAYARARSGSGDSVTALDLASKWETLLVGREPQVDDFLEFALGLVHTSGAHVSVRHLRDSQLEFAVSSEKIERAEPDALGILRMICARLAVLSAGGGLPSFYGVTFDGALSLGAVTVSTRLVFHNAMNGQIFFALSPAAGPR